MKRKPTFVIVLGTIFTGMVSIYRHENPQQHQVQNDDRADHLADEITIVTAFFNMGNFPKGKGFFRVSEYLRWTKAFALIENPVHAFFDDPRVLKMFENIRKPLNASLTKTTLVNRSQLWAFQDIPIIEQIFNNTDYPKHQPNTVRPEYPCIMHAKYELLEKATKENAFRTKFIAWLDIGLFRHQVFENSTTTFYLWLPPNFDAKRVAYNIIQTRNESLSPFEIILSNSVWINGGYFVAGVDLMVRWTQQYRRAVNFMLHKHHLMSTDQQVLYFMFNHMSPVVDVQTYEPITGYNRWFSLAYLSKDEGEKRQKAIS